MIQITATKMPPALTVRIMNLVPGTAQVGSERAE